MDLNLNNKIAVVTGGSLGIGKAVARELSYEGVTVVICARRLGPLEEAAESIMQDTQNKVVPIVADTTDTYAVQQLIDKTAEQFGKIDILVNNAAVIGGLIQGQLEEAPEHLLTEDLNTKVVGYFRTSKAVASHMKKQEWGRIINIGGLSGRYAGAISGMRNAAVAHLTKTLSGQLGPYKITVNAIHPGTIRTERTIPVYESESIRTNRSKDELESQANSKQAIGRIVDASEIGNLVCFLSSDKAAAITGQIIGIDGGAGNAVFY